MTDLRDAAQQALEALELLAQPTKTNNETPRYKAHKAAITTLRAALEQPEQEPVAKSTWQKLYEAAIDQRNEAVALNQELLQALKDATDAIEHWGAYASDFFQQKWDLHSDINAARAAIARAEGQS